MQCYGELMLPESFFLSESFRRRQIRHEHEQSSNLCACLWLWLEQTQTPSHPSSSTASHHLLFVSPSLPFLPLSKPSLVSIHRQARQQAGQARQAGQQTADSREKTEDRRQLNLQTGRPQTADHTLVELTPRPPITINPPAAPQKSQLATAKLHRRLYKRPA